MPLKVSVLQATLNDLIAAQVANSASSDGAFWNSADSLSLNFFDMIDFVIQPHVVNRLIMEDLDGDEKAAQDIRLMSYEYGLEFNREDDELMDCALQDVRADVMKRVSCTEPGLKYTDIFYCRMSITSWPQNCRRIETTPSEDLDRLQPLVQVHRQ